MLWPFPVECIKFKWTSMSVPWALESPLNFLSFQYNLLTISHVGPCLQGDCSDHWTTLEPLELRGSCWEYHNRPARQTNPKAAPEKQFLRSISKVSHSSFIGRYSTLSRKENEIILLRPREPLTGNWASVRATPIDYVVARWSLLRRIVAYWLYFIQYTLSLSFPSRLLVVLVISKFVFSHVESFESFLCSKPWPSVRFTVFVREKV